MQPDADNSSSADDLSEVIRLALQLPADPERVRRLQRFWVLESQRQRWRKRRRQLFAVAAAAIVAIAGGVGFWSFGSRSGLQPERLVEDSEPEGGSLNPDDLLAGESTLPSTRSAGRLPTAYERFVFVATTRTRIGTSSPSLEKTIDDLVASVSATLDGDARHAFAAADVSRAAAERLLLRKIPRSSPEELVAIVRLLGVCGASESTAALIRLSRREDLRADALDAVEQIVGTERLSEAARYATDRRVRRDLAARLLTAETDGALRSYLSLVRSDATRADALTALDNLAEPPAAQLLALLDDDDKDLRLSAAIVLGHVSGSEVTEALIARVTNDPGDSPAAWMALLACRDPLAEQFLTYATHRPQLLGYFNNARLKWAQMIP